MVRILLQSSGMLPPVQHGSPLRAEATPSVRSERVVTRNFLALGAGEAVSRLIAFTATVYIAHRLGPSLFGAIGVTGAILLYFNRVVDGGLELGLGVREVAAAPETLDRLVPSLLTVRLALAAALAALLTVVGTLWLPQPEGALLAIYGLTLLPAGASTRWVHLGFDRSRLIATALILGQALMALLVVLLVRAPGDAGWVPGAQFVGDSFVALVLLWWFRAHGMPLAIRVDWPVVRALAHRARSLVGSALLGLWIYSSGMIFLRIFHDRSVVGYFGAAYTITTFFLNLGAAYGLSLLPSLTRLNTNQREQQGLYHTATAQAFAASLPIAVGGALLARGGMQLLFGSEYAVSGTVFFVLAWSIPACLLRDVALAPLVARGREPAVFRVTLAAAVLSLGLNLALIPRYGAVGAAWATLGTEVARMAFAMAAVRREAIRLPSPARFWRSLVAGAGMAAVLLLLPAFAPPVAVLVGGASYAAGLYLLGGLQVRRGQLPALTV
jgi:O-antigen/teichoic acid export membrane protein